MPEKHYGVANANRSIVVNGTALRFTPYDHSAGAWTGFYSTSNPAEQVALDALIEVKEIFRMTGAEIEEIKKKAPNLRSSTVSQDQLAQLENAEVAEKVEVEDLPEVEDILNVEKVAKAEVKKRGRKRKL
jgi:hypothetical protein